MTLSKLTRVSKFLAKTGLLAISAIASLLTASMLILMGSGEEDVLESYSSSIIKLITLQYIFFFSIIDLQKLKRPIATTLGFGSIAAIMLALFYVRHTSNQEALLAQYLLILCIAITAGFYLGAEN